MLSRSTVVWPTSTASASARWRNKCILSSRDVKSTGPNSRVVILPSTVMANVAMTNGRNDLPCEDVDLLLRLADLMFQRGDFALHLAQGNALREAAWLIEKVN